MFPDLTRGKIVKNPDRRPETYPAQTSSAQRVLRPHSHPEFTCPELDSGFQDLSYTRQMLKLIQ